MRFAEDWCVEQGVDKLALDASCCNERAIGLYKDMGFHTRRLRMVKELQVGDNDDELARQPREGFLSDLQRRFGDTFD